MKIYNTRMNIELKKPEKKKCDPILKMVDERIGTRDFFVGGSL